MVQVTDTSESIYDDFRKETDIYLKPHQRQEDFLCLPDEVFEALYGGAAYGGKSWILTMLPLFRGFYKYRGFKGIILRRKFPDLEREIIRLSKEWYPKTGAKYNDQKHSWEWPEYGSYMDFGHVQHSSDISMYDSAQYNYCAFDELTHFEEYPYMYMVGSRIRPGSGFKIAIVRNGTNPGGIGQTFCYNRFVKPCEDGYTIIKDLKTLDPNTGKTLLRIFIPARLEDNPHGMEYDPMYGQKLELLPEAEKKAKKYGDWHAFRGSVFTTFRPIRFNGEPDNALHVIPGFQIPDWWPRILSIDWGKRAMCHALWAAISPDKRVYIYREKSWNNRDIAYWAGEIRETNYEAGENITYTILCGSAWQDRGVDTVAQQFTQHSGLAAETSSNSPGTRITGLQLVHEFLRWEPRQTLKSKGYIFDFEYSQKLLRMKGQEAYDEYKHQFMDEEPEKNIPKLQIFECCKILIETIPVAIYDENKTEDIAEFDGDDPLDNLRYLCKAVNRFMKGEIGKMDHMVKIQQAISNLQVTGDMTQFYRQMERIEAKHPLIPQKVLRSRGIIARRRSRYASLH